MHINFYLRSDLKKGEKAAWASAAASEISLPIGRGKELNIEAEEGQETFFELLIPVGYAEQVEEHLAGKPGKLSVGAIWGDKEKGDDFPAWKTVVPQTIYNSDGLGLRIILPETWKARQEHLKYQLKHVPGPGAIFFVYLFCRDYESGGLRVDLVAVESPVDGGGYARLDLWRMNVTGTVLAPTGLVNNWGKPAFHEQGAWVECLDLSRQKVYGALHHAVIGEDGGVGRKVTFRGGVAARTNRNVKEIIG